MLFIFTNIIVVLAIFYIVQYWMVQRFKYCKNCKLYINVIEGKYANLAVAMSQEEENNEDGRLSLAYNPSNLLICKLTYKTQKQV